MLKSFAVGNNFEFKGFIDVGTGSVAMLVEDKTDFNLSFIRIQKISEIDGVDLITTGMDGGSASRNMIKSPVKDIRSIMQKDEDDKYFHVAVALRQNGQLDFYSDFRLVDQSLEGEMYLDIECDFKQFYVKRNDAKIG